MLQLANTHLNNGKPVSESGNQLRTFTLLSQFSSSSSIYSTFWSSLRGCIPNMHRLAHSQKKLGGTHAVQAHRAYMYTIWCQMTSRRPLYTRRSRKLVQFRRLLTEVVSIKQTVLVWELFILCVNMLGPWYWW